MYWNLTMMMGMVRSSSSCVSGASSVGHSPCEGLGLDMLGEGSPPCQPSCHLLVFYPLDVLVVVHMMICTRARRGVALYTACPQVTWLSTPGVVLVGIFSWHQVVFCGPSSGCLQAFSDLTCRGLPSLQVFDALVSEGPSLLWSSVFCLQYPAWVGCHRAISFYCDDQTPADSA
jgi:hypothetical protein